MFADLPFVVEPTTFTGGERTVRNQEHTSLWIVAKADLRATPPGGSVRAVEVRLPMPTAHLFADRAEVDGRLRVVLQHMPLSDLLITQTAPGYEGLIALGVQPSVIGRYEIDLVTGEVLAADLAVDEARAWGGVLPAVDDTSAAARSRHRQLWYAGAGYDPDLVPEAWYRLYGDATDGLVAPADLPSTPIAGSLARIDLEAAKVAEVWSYADGAFPSPPTFVPASAARTPTTATWWWSCTATATRRSRSSTPCTSRPARSPRPRRPASARASCSTPRGCPTGWAAGQRLPGADLARRRGRPPWPARRARSVRQDGAVGMAAAAGRGHVAHSAAVTIAAPPTHVPVAGTSPKAR